MDPGGRLARMIPTRELVRFWLIVAAYAVVCAATWLALILAVLWVLP